MTPQEFAQVFGISKQAVYQRLQSKSDATVQMTKFILSFSRFDVMDRLARIEAFEKDAGEEMRILEGGNFVLLDRGEAPADPSRLKELDKEEVGYARKTDDGLWVFFPYDDLEEVDEEYYIDKTLLRLFTDDQSGKQVWLSSNLNLSALDKVTKVMKMQLAKRGY